MSDEVRLALALTVSLVVASALVPAVMRLARRVGFLDHPVGHKVHKAPTPYLGGTAVVIAFLVGSVAMGGNVWRLWPILVGTVVLAVIGTIDDRQGVPPRYRVSAELALALLLTATGTGWDFVSGGLVQFALTAAWIVGYVNAFNLMDNMDGAAGTVGAVCSAGVAALAIVENDIGLAAMMLAMTGACLGFLRFNLIRKGRARVFLGDGGSMPLGFTIAACATQVTHKADLGWPVLLTAGLLMAAPTFDTLLVVISRTRRGVAMTQGGQDHLTHRLASRVGSPVAVAVTLVLLQAAVSTAAILAFGLGRGAIVWVAFGSIAVALGLVAFIDRASWAPTPPLRTPAAVADRQAQLADRP